jgi:hypothetical protein
MYNDYHAQRPFSAIEFLHIGGFSYKMRYVSLLSCKKMMHVVVCSPVSPIEVRHYFLTILAQKGRSRVPGEGHHIARDKVDSESVTTCSINTRYLGGMCVYVT